MKIISYAKGKTGSGKGPAPKGGPGGKTTGGGRPTPPPGSGGYPSTVHGHDSGKGRFDPSSK